VPIILMKAQLALETRRKTQIQNEMNRAIPTHGMLALVAKYRREYPDATHRDVGPCSTYNCHGLTFASRRTWLPGTGEIQRILEDDDYNRIEAKDAGVGDVVVYSLQGIIEHTGIIVECLPFNDKKVLSKWGNLHEVVHKLADCPWRDYDKFYYRVVR